jgi:GNAT superfamily N-acetyltransferase
MPRSGGELIRPAQVGDAAAIAPLLGELGYPTDPAAVPARLQSLLDGPDTGVLVAERGGRVIGLAAYQLTTLLYSSQPSCRLTALVVDGRNRGRGAAKALVSEVEAIARQNGCFRVEVTTRPSRSEALLAYGALGFQRRPHRLVKTLEP